MALQIQIQSPSLLDLLKGGLQQALDTTCLPSFTTPADTFYIDHADVLLGAMSSSIPGEAIFPVNVFMVRQSDAIANMNGTPPGATSPAGQITVNLQVAVTGTVVSLSCTSVALGSLQAVLDAALGSSTAASVPSQIQSLIQSNLEGSSVDLGPMFSQLGLPSPSTSTIAEDSNSVFILFDADEIVDSLQPGQQWCFLINSATMQNLAVARVNAILPTLHQPITSSATSAAWAPAGTVPHVNVTVTGNVDVPDPLSGNFEMDLGIDFDLQTPFGLAELEQIVTWNFSISTGVAIVDAIIELEFEEQFNPASFGGTPAGPNQFSLESELPTITLGGANLQYSSIAGLAAGMVLGGPVTGIPVEDNSVVRFDVGSFPSQVLQLEPCLGPKSAPTLSSVFISAWATCSPGTVCSAVSVPGSYDVQNYIAAGSTSVGVNLNGVVCLAAAQSGKPIELLVQTTRGVRAISFGDPPLPEVDSHGNVTNARVLLINNCPIAVDPWFQVFKAYNPAWTPDPPIDWLDHLEDVAVFQSSLISLADLNAGELVTLTQRLNGGVSIVSAGQAGAAVVPALLAVRSIDEEAVLMRANRSSLGTPALSTMLFQRMAVLQTPGAVSHELSGTARAATIVTTFADGSSRITLIDSLGTVRSRSDSISERANKVSSDMPKAMQNASDWPLDVPGLIKVLPVPGFEGEPIAVAKLSDGACLLLERQPDTSIRVAGFVPRWPDMPPVSGNWAISSAIGDRIAVFRVSRMGAPVCGCQQSAC